jgi:hypothetical protein
MRLHSVRPAIIVIPMFPFTAFPSSATVATISTCSGIAGIFMHVMRRIAQEFVLNRLLSSFTACFAPPSTNHRAHRSKL